MTFVNEKFKSQNKLIKNYLDNRKLLKQKNQRENFAKQQLQQSASELFRPITKTFQETQQKTDEKQDKIIQNIEEQLSKSELAIENVPQASCRLWKVF